MQIEWDDLINNIEQQKCVLILGPELVSYSGKTFFELLSEDMQRERAAYVRHFFMNEELVQFDRNVPAHEARMYNFLTRFYRQRHELDDVIDQIVQLPFPVFISLFPDARLTDAFKTRQLDFSEAHYPREQNPTEVELPSRAKPLVYSLLGTLENFDTVLTFDHLFEYLKGILGSRELPKNLRVALKDAKCFVFVGVKFDKWHMQVLLKMLMDGSPGLRYAASNLVNDDVRTFIGNRLELDFIDQEPADFLKALYDQCFRRNWLRGKPPISGRVFISYSYKDDQLVNRLRQKLEEAGLTVIIGQVSMNAGEIITAFIQDSVASTDCTISVVSENSLMSPWVALESATILREKERQHKLFIPCYVEPSFLDSGVTDRILTKIEQRIEDMGNQIQQRIAQKRPMDDLTNQIVLNTNHHRDTANYISLLRNSNVIDLTEAHFDAGVARMIKDIQGFITSKSNG